MRELTRKGEEKKSFHGRRRNERTDKEERMEDNFEGKDRKGGSAQGLWLLI